MNRLFLKYCLATVAAFPIVTGLHAQQSVGDTSEIVITRDELTDLLSKVAAGRKAQLAARSKYAPYLKQFAGEGPLANNIGAVVGPVRDEYVYAELQHINNKLDLLLRAPAVTHSPVVPAAGDTYSSDMETVRLQQQISSAREELRVISRLSAINTSNTEYSKDIAALNARVEGLTRQLNRSRRINYTPPVIINQQPGKNTALQNAGVGNNASLFDETAAIRRQVDSLSDQIKWLQSNSANSSDTAGYRIDSLYRVIGALNSRLQEAETAPVQPDQPAGGYLVYFDNNSAFVKPEYYAGLERLVTAVKENADGATLVVRGFTSSTGSALYNNRLSFLRAEAVRDWLIQQGLNARNIAVFPHGVDPLASEQGGRRVELSIRIH